MLLYILLLAGPAAAATKVHVIGFGKWMTVPWIAPSERSISMKVRGLVVDGRVKEYTLGPPHDVTERLFVVQRAFRMNDSLPDDTGPRWQWQRGGWLLVDRLTGKVSAVNLPDFDTGYSIASWYRDYAAYCGVGEDGKKTYAMVAQLSRKKAVLKKELSDPPVAGEEAADSRCAPPFWQRGPTRVSFEPASGAKQTFAIHGHAVNVVNDDEEEE